MHFPLRNFSTEDFLAKYWQQQPGVFRQVLPDFCDPLDEHDLAGLAQEEDVDSRAIVRSAKGWQVYQGPFEDFTDVCQDKWSLLVQGVDRYLPAAAELMEKFSFIPYWRMDDLMVSFAVAGAGVGAHVDQYDVFLIQGKGSRRWRVGPPSNYKPVFPHPNLAQIEDFTPLLEVTLYPGDMLYVPPGWAHDGVALEDCLTYSVGFRAPDVRQISEGVSAMFADEIAPMPRYSDMDLAAQNHPGEITSEALSKMKQLFFDHLNEGQWNKSLARMLSEQQLVISPLMPPLTEISLAAELQNGAVFTRVPGCRPLYLKDGDSINVFIDGEQFSGPLTDEKYLLDILKGMPVSQQNLTGLDNEFALFQLLTILINKGYWELHHEEE